MRRKGYLLLAVVCGLLAAGSSYVYLRGHASPQTATRPLVVAARDISARTVITAQDLRVIANAAEGYPRGGVADEKEFTGNVALVALRKGDPVLQPEVGILAAHPSGNSSGTSSASSAFSLGVPPGKRAMAIPITVVSGVGYRVRAGDYVDVLVTVKNNNSLATTSLAAQDILVLGSETPLDAKTPAKTYILAVTPDEALKITSGLNNGPLELLLRNPEDK